MLLRLLERNSKIHCKMINPRKKDYHNQLGHTFHALMFLMNFQSRIMEVCSSRKAKEETIVVLNILLKESG